MIVITRTFNHEPRAIVRFRGRKVQVRYHYPAHEEYGYLWNFVSVELDDRFLTDAEHNSVCRQIRQHAERSKRSTRLP
jgi:hypothetical protein